MLLKVILSFLNCHIYFPLPLLGCGVLGMSLLRSSKSIGEYASDLLKALEYRGYDSTGAAIQNGKDVTLLKGVGAPSLLVDTLKIRKQEGRLFCGQVRWATFGRVNYENSQPHIVKCKRYIYGAHNGNITNMGELSAFFTSEGHTIASDNDGEIVVHAVEHYFDIELNQFPVEEQLEESVRRSCFRQAISKACEKLVGSFAAIIVDPVTEIMYAIKSGSSLYFGVGEIENQKFTLASSDLTAALRFTKNMVDLREGEFAEFTADDFQIVAFKDVTIKRHGRPVSSYKRGEEIARKPERSKLRAEDTELLPEYSYFMEQEIHSTPEATRKLIKIFQGGSNSGKMMHSFLKSANLLSHFEDLHNEIFNAVDFDQQQALFDSAGDSELGKKFFEKSLDDYPAIHQELTHGNFSKRFFFSNDKNLFLDLAGDEFENLSLLIAKALDSITEQNDIVEFNSGIDRFLLLMEKAIVERRNIYVVACGSSYHAALIGAMYFNQIAEVGIKPVLPGDFRGHYLKCLKDDDIIIGVSQSGETKDLINVIDDIASLGRKISKVMLVNNMNSTLGQEKSDVSIPVFCGPEMAVPATKSFTNQLTLFYYLATKTLGKRIEMMKSSGTKDYQEIERTYKRRWRTLENIPELISETIKLTADSVERVASSIHGSPSAQILATGMSGVAKEGALKIRETVLNHTEGSEASEFKHGPNTILGKNTVYGLESISSMSKEFHYAVGKIYKLADERGIDSSDVKDIIQALSVFVFERSMPFNLTKKGTILFKELVQEYDFFGPMMINYPLIYITGPDERDINLTISQMNTHKIRGGSTFIVAEGSKQLMENAYYDDESGRYSWDFIKLPKTGDALMVTISATIAIQLLSLGMSVKKMKYLDKLGMLGHGVHPDVPKNVSKSITVD
ncbi:MAG: SIS domain-containing protein [Bdellovibrionales bacterium]|jgi:glutamine---fructose-6-phosphate transaminase (isomerizing)|nr:SIS domain-containing protein [Bdellovibrionales bacterium]MBT3525110.1 SIS domain-containing protein [Bdellovibrionales bacterium]MBT7765818.1 SIS domain-containing protein [Bdellovibrionales bacterium]